MFIILKPLRNCQSRSPMEQHHSRMDFINIDLKKI